MRLSYCTTIKDEVLGAEIIPDLECELDIDMSRHSGATVFDVTAVFLEGKNLYRGTLYTQPIAAQIATEATDKLNMEGTRIRGRALAALERRAA